MINVYIFARGGGGGGVRRLCCGQMTWFCSVVGRQRLHFAHTCIQHGQSRSKHGNFNYCSNMECIYRRKGGRIFFYVSPWPHKTGSVGRSVDLFIKYVSNNVYSDNNHGQPGFLQTALALVC